MDRAVYLIRFFWYILKYTILGLLIGAVMAAGFFVAKDTANVYIIATEGMEVRAANILNLSQVEEMNKYFVENYSSTDYDLATNKYDDFFIRDFEYKLKIESLWANPWEDTAYVRAVEKVPDIDGEYPVDDEEEVPLVMPKWQSARYAITLVKLNDAWYIQQVVKLEEVAEETASTQAP